MDAVEKAREQVATLIAAEDPSQIFFTSGATESNNWVLKCNPGWLIAVSVFEHSSLREPAWTMQHEVLEANGVVIEPPNVVMDLISMMSVNNEIGTCWSVDKFLEYASYFHSDVTQDAGKLPVDLHWLDLASLSAHKFD